MNSKAELKALWTEILRVDESKSRNFHDDLHSLFESMYSFLESLVDKLEDLEEKVNKLNNEVYPQS